MSNLSRQWLWFFDDQLIHDLLKVQPDDPRLARRAASHPAVVRGMQLCLEGMPEEALAELEGAIVQDDADGIALAGQIHFERGRIERAARLFARLVEAFPGHPCASLNLGLCQARNRDWVEAIESLQRALVLHPDRAEVWFALGVCLVNEKRVAEAQAAFSRSLRLRNEYAPAWFGQAVCHQLEGKPAEALVIYEKLMEGQPLREQILTNALSAAAASRNVAKVRTLASRLLQLRPQSTAPHNALAWIAIEEGEFDEALRHCEIVARGNPDSFEHWYNYGVCLLRLRQFELASSAFHNALLLRSNDVDASEGFAQSLTEAGRMEEARAAWAALLEKAPQRVDAWFRLGLLAAKAGDYQGAEAAFESCVQCKSDWLDAWANLGNARWAAGNNTGASAAFRNVLEANPFHTGARRAMAALAVERGDSADAETYLEGLPQRDWEILYNLAALLHADGMLDRAVVLYREVLGVKPDCVEARFNLGSVLFGLGRVQEGQSNWKAAVAERPELAAQILGWIGKDVLDQVPVAAHS